MADQSKPQTDNTFPEYIPSWKPPEPKTAPNPDQISKHQHLPIIGVFAVVIIVGFLVVYGLIDGILSTKTDNKTYLDKDPSEWTYQDKKDFQKEWDELDKYLEDGKTIDPDYKGNP